MTYDLDPSTDAQVRLQDLRIKIVNGDRVSPEEYASVLASLRKGRAADLGPSGPKGARTRARKGPDPSRVNPLDLLLQEIPASPSGLAKPDPTNPGK